MWALFSFLSNNYFNDELIIGDVGGFFGDPEPELLVRWLISLIFSLSFV